MPLATLYWVLMLFWLFYGLWANYTAGQPYPFFKSVGHILTFALFVILGYQLFNGIVH